MKPGAKKLRIGYMKDISLCEASPPNARALQMVKDALIKAGHEIIDYQIPDEENIFVRMNQVLTNDGEFNDLYANWKYGEPLLSSYSNQVMIKKIPTWIKRIIIGITKQIPMLKRLGIALEGSIEFNVDQINQMAADREEYIAKMIAGINKLGLDCIICPGLATPAVRNYHNSDAVYQCMYTLCWNFVNFPTGCVQITRVRKEEEYYESRFLDPITAQLRQNMVGSCGLPVGIQIVGLPYCDEKVLAVMQYVEDLMQTKGIGLPVKDIV